MANYLYRLGRFAYSRHRLVAVVWVAMLVVFGIGAFTLAQPTSNSFTIPGTESQQAIDLLAQQFPQLNASGASAHAVVQAPAGQTLTSAANKAAVEKIVAELKAAPQVGSVVDPYQAGAINPSGTIANIQVAYAVSQINVTDAARTALSNIAAAGRTGGMTVEVGGDAFMAPPGQDLTEGIGVAIAAVVLFITFGSIVAAGLPLLSAFVGIAFGLSGIAIASNFVPLSSNTSTLAMMLGLAVAIDYSLFIVSRYRHEIATGRDGPEAAGRAVATAGSAVLFAGMTVVIALAALSIVGIPILTQMGLAAAFTVLVSVLIALSLLPALLGFAGRRLQPATNAPDPEGNGTETGVGFRWARFVTGRPIPVLIVAVAGLLLVAAPVLGLRLGLPDDSASAPSSTQHKAYDLLSAGFGPGANGPLIVVVEASSSSDPKAAATKAIGVVGHLKDVASVTPAMFDATGETAIFQVIPASGPSSQATENLVTAIRQSSIAFRSDTGATLAVTGQTAVNIDLSATMAAALLPYLLVVVGLALVLLTIVFRSIVVPLKATLGFVLSIAATFGAVVAVFQWGWLAPVFGVQQTAPIISLLPVMLIGVVFGLAMDYEVFLVTRMREEYAHGAEPLAAVVTGFGHGARVVSAAAIIMISVFGGFIFSNESFIKPIGFALAMAVLLDAFVVRMTIVPAVMAIAGERAWWLPRWLGRLLPSVDIDGARARPSPDMAPAGRAGSGVPVPVPVRIDEE